MAAPATTPATTVERNERRTLQGVVTRDKTDKTRRVEVSRRVQHPKYGKFIKQRTVCYAHDEKNDSHLGDLVEIRESRPLSKTKRWALVRVVTKAPSRQLAALEGAVAGATPDAAKLATAKATTAAAKVK